MSFLRARRAGRRGLLVLAVVVVSLGAAAGIAYATIPDSPGGVIHACYQGNNGQLRLIDPQGSLNQCTEL